jgi:hypothetical protein
MHISPTNATIAAAGAAAQSAGVDNDRATVEGARRRALFFSQKAQAAAGIAEADGAEHEPSGGGDADRPLVERLTPQAGQSAPPVPPPDPRRQSGTMLDLTG